MESDKFFDQVEQWLFRSCLPFWAAHGPDRQYGGFIEDLTLDGADAARDFKRVRVPCRQVYAFSHAKVLGFDDGAPLIIDGVEYLATRAWMPEKQAFARRLTRAGDVLDDTIDLYEHAFALFAFAWAYRATGEAACAQWAGKTADAIERHLRAPGTPGFYHQTPAEGWRQQNPHMHLLEASLAAYEFLGEDRYRDFAREVAGLFRSKFFDRKNQTLTEFFQDDWVRAPGEAGEIVEPGHHYEWAWILRRCAAVLGEDFSTEIDALVGFANAHGVDPRSHAARNCVSRTGEILDGGSRTWPNTERVKAGVVLLEGGDMTGAEMVRQSAGLLLARYLSSSAGVQIPAGGWIDAFDADGRPAAKLMPASTLYHVVLAFVETLRVKDLITGKG
ncbi:MAG: AGE family epimerase/isomerase [Parvularculaceae bacterium]